jgi:hypothetical protein
MAIVVKFEVRNMDSGKYDRIIQDLAGIGQGAPAGRNFHVSYGDKGRLQVIDVYESPAALEAFGAKLMPILKKHGVEATPEVLGEAHNIIAGR